MTHNDIELKSTDFELDFLLDSKALDPDTPNKLPYKILIADDDQEVHNSTTLLLKNFKFEGHPLEIHHSFSGAETIAKLKEITDFALIFLDVVMEENNSGLQVVEVIRKVIQNRKIRIIIRTGQPGVAPEDEIIQNYDINDYRLKTDMTSSRLFASVYEALRSYRDIMTIESHKQGLEQIIQMSSKLFTLNNLEEFYATILDQLMNLSHTSSDLIYFREPDYTSGLVILEDFSEVSIIAATGKYEPYIGQSIESLPIAALPDELFESVQRHHDDPIIETSEGLLIYKTSNTGIRSYIYIEGNNSKLDTRLLRVFLSNYTLALDNFIMTQNALSVHQEMISLLGDTIEARSLETGSHVRRVSKYSSLIASTLGLPENVIEFIAFGSPMHDIGKVSIPDSILSKPSQLTSEEFEEMKSHALVGYNILAKSRYEIIKYAALIARDHHERYDGSGYPNGLSGESIHLGARIVALADVFDALTHSRSYKKAWTFEEARDYIIANAGTQFDPKIVNAFIDLQDEFRLILDVDLD